MKRIVAFAINYFIFLLFYVIIDFFFLFLFFRTNAYFIDSNAIFTCGYYMVAIGSVFLYIYWLMLDLATGIDVGKKITKIEIASRLTVKIAFWHSFLKCCCSMVWPITLCVYMLTKRMPYDKWLGISINEKE